jgi:nucleotide-binding universal stress UspA family protein
MSYKTILVHVDNSKHIARRIETAVNIAVHENAHLIGAAMTGVSRYLYETLALTPGDPAIAPHLGTLRKRATDALAEFENIVQRVGVASYEKRLVDDEPAGGLSLQARFCDLVILGQYDPDESFTLINSDLPEYVAMHGGSPVLLIPYAGRLKTVGEQILIAWNDSLEAKRAIHGALPLLRQAKHVDIALFLPFSQPDKYSETPGDDIALYLARHNVNVNVVLKTRNDTTHGGIGITLLSIAADQGSDMLVMGCYGHSLFRQMLLGGVSRTILESMTIPVLMSH